MEDIKIEVIAPEGVSISKKEQCSYIDHIKKNNPNRKIEWVKIKIDDEGYANLTYSLAPIDFERIRRITGYLTGDTKTWNNAKQAELKDRVKHNGCC